MRWGVGDSDAQAVKAPAAARSREREEGNFMLSVGGSNRHFNPMTAPEQIALLGEEVAIRWADGRESFYPMAYLREMSPSAENMGETDLLENRYGGDGTAKYPGVRVTGWGIIGGYAVQFHFSDGHNTGLFTYDYLRKLADRA